MERGRSLELCGEDASAGRDHMKTTEKGERERVRRVWKEEDGGLGRERESKMLRCHREEEAKTRVT